LGGTALIIIVKSQLYKNNDAANESINRSKYNGWL